MNTLVINTQDVRAQEVEVTEDTLVVSLADGRTIIVPIAWPDLDEDLSVTGILAGRHSKENPESLKKWLNARNKK